MFYGWSPETVYLWDGVYNRFFRVGVHKHFRVGGSPELF